MLPSATTLFVNKIRASYPHSICSKQADYKNVRTATATMTAKTLPPKLFDPLSIKSFEPALFVELLPPPPCEKEVPVAALPAAVPVAPPLPSVPDELCAEPELVVLS